MVVTEFSNTMNDPLKPITPNSQIKPERRALQRALLEISGCLSDGNRRLDCIVLELSLGGAMVKIDASAFRETGASEIESEELIVTLEIAAPVPLLAKVVWRRKSVLGLQFLQPPDEVAEGLERLLPANCFKGLADAMDLNSTTASQ